MSAVDTVTEVKPGQRQIQEYGFREIVKTDRVSVLNHTDLPWLPSEPAGFKGHIVKLNRATTISGESFYLGSLVRGRLLDQADRFTPDESDRANKLFYCSLQKFLHDSNAVKPLEFAKTETDLVPPEKRRKIWEASNGRGAIRMFFIQDGVVDGIPVFIKVAISAGKPSEIEVLSELVTQNRKEIKKQCLGK